MSLLLKKHTNAGWHVVDTHDNRLAAERLFSLPGFSSSTIRVEGDNQEELRAAIDLRESQLSVDPAHGVVASPPQRTPSSEELELQMRRAEKTVKP